MSAPLSRQTWENIDQETGRSFLQKALDAGWSIPPEECADFRSPTHFLIEGHGVVFGVTYDPHHKTAGITIVDKGPLVKVSDQSIFAAIQRAAKGRS